MVVDTGIHSFNWTREHKERLIQDENPKHIFIVGDLLDKSGTNLKQDIKNEIYNLSLSGFIEFNYEGNYVHLIRDN